MVRQTDISKFVAHKRSEFFEALQYIFDRTGNWIFELVNRNAIVNAFDRSS
jgi:hypothetical protein